MPLQSLWRIKCDNIRPHACRTYTKPYRSTEKAEQRGRADGWQQIGGLWFCPFHAENSSQARAVPVVPVGQLFGAPAVRRPINPGTAVDVVTRMLGETEVVTVTSNAHDHRLDPWHGPAECLPLGGCDAHPPF